MVHFIVKDMAVPINSVPACPLPNATGTAELDFTMTPLLTTTLHKHEDLALQLLALSDQGSLNLDSRSENGNTLLIYAAQSNAARVI